MRRQRRWAERAGRVFDARGYFAHVDDNLRVPPAPSTLAAFEDAASAELAAGRTRPPRFLALHSSAALAVNVFEHWCDRDSSPLLDALGVDGAARVLGFEAPFPTGLAGDPPYIDVAIELDSGRVVAIESKFTEWLTRRPPNRSAFKPKYFAAGARLWDARGLPRCQALAHGVQDRAVRFRHLNAAQLLKQALALATRAPAGGFSLYYLYYDSTGREAALHREETERFGAHVVPEIDFRAMSYQALYRSLAADTRVDAAYLRYLRERYFAAPAKA